MAEETKKSMRPLLRAMDVGDEELYKIEQLSSVRSSVSILQQEFVREGRKYEIQKAEDFKIRVVRTS